MCHTMQILHVVEIRLLGRAQCPRQGTLAVAVPAADRAHTPPSEGTGGPKGRDAPSGCAFRSIITVVQSI